MKATQKNPSTTAAVLFALALGTALPSVGYAADVAALANVSNQDASGALRELLSRGAGLAVDRLGISDGFLGNDAVRIPLPKNIQKAEKLLNAIGMKEQTAELKTKMNRAAESAVKEAKPLFMDAIKSMSVDDAKNILIGGNTSGTEFFKKKTSDTLRAKFRPIVDKATENVKLADQYNALASKASATGLLKGEETNIQSYVTERALDGLFYMVAEEEKSLRANPMKAASGLLQRVFGALK